jgi:hypothetical protein
MTNNNNNRRNNRSNPVSYNPVLQRSTTSLPRVVSGKDIIVTDFTGTASWGSSDYSINPRLADKFPSANLTAQRYDMYQFEELVFRYHPTTAVTNTKGVIFLAWEPNANRGPPDTLAQINAFEHHTEGPIYNPNITLRVPKNRLGPPKYTRDGPTCSDLNLFDTGKLIVASDDVTGSEGGYIEVFYRIRFMNYHLEETTPVQNRAAEVSLITSSQSISTGVATQVAFNSLLEDFNGDDTIALASGEVTLPKGKYLVSTYVNVRDDTAESFSAQIAISKNSVATAAVSRQVIHGASAVQDSCVCTSTVVSSSGSDTVGTICTATGAAGNLSIMVGSRMTILALS